MTREQAGDRQTAAGTADDGHAGAVDACATLGGRGASSRPDRREQEGLDAHRTRKMKRARMDSSAVTIQNRITIFDSWTPSAS